MPGRTTRRPSAARPSAGNSSGGTAPSRQQGNMPSAEEVRNYPDFVDEGENLSLDPEDASIGFMSDEDVTIMAASFHKFVYRRRIGDDLVDIDVFDDGRPAIPELRLFVTFRRDENSGETVEEAYKYGSYGLFGASKDGNHPRVWPKVLVERKSAPQPRKTAAAVIFLESLKEAGLAVNELNDKGVEALVGLKCHVSRRKVKGMHERAKALVLVDTIEGVDTDAVRGTATTSSSSSSPIVESSSDTESQLTDIILGLLDENGGAVEKNEIPKALLSQVDDSNVRQQLMKLSRNKAFIESDDAPWTLDGTTLIQK